MEAASLSAATDYPKSAGPHSESRNGKKMLESMKLTSYPYVVQEQRNTTNHNRPSGRKSTEPSCQVTGGTTDSLKKRNRQIRMKTSGTLSLAPLVNEKIFHSHDGIFVCYT
jgi:hypothetical protein